MLVNRRMMMRVVRVYRIWNDGGRIEERGTGSCLLNRPWVSIRRSRQDCGAVTLMVFRRHLGSGVINSFGEDLRDVGWWCRGFGDAVGVLGRTPSLHKWLNLIFNKFLSVHTVVCVSRADASFVCCWFDLIQLSRGKELWGGDRDFEPLVVLDIDNCLAI